jgi:hypothetical protein
VLYYRVVLDVPLPLMIKIPNLLKKHRKEIGTRNGTRALTCWQQAKFVLAWFRDKPDIRRPGQGPGISQATACRHEDEGTGVLKAQAPDLHEALEKAAEQGIPCVILDGTLVSSGRCPGKKTSRKGTETGKWYPGKAHEHAGLIQGIIAPDGTPLRVPDVLPGSACGITAARQQVLPGLRPWLKDLPALADSGYEGAGTGIPVPVRKPREGEPDTNAKTRNMLLRGLRCQGERGFAVMKERWAALRHVSVDPSQIGDIAKAALFLTQFEHRLIS